MGAGLSVDNAGLAVYPFISAVVARSTIARARDSRCYPVDGL